MPRTPIGVPHAPPHDARACRLCTAYPYTALALVDCLVSTLSAALHDAARIAL